MDQNKACATPTDDPAHRLNPRSGPTLRHPDVLCSVPTPRVDSRSSGRPLLSVPGHCTVLFICGVAAGTGTTGTLYESDKILLSHSSAPTT